MSESGIKSSRLFEAIDALAKLAAVVSLIGGGLWTAWQYAQAKDAQRVERTLSYITRFEDGSVSLAAAHLKSVLRSHLGQFEELEREGLGAEGRAEIVLTIADETVDGRTVAEDLDAIVQFYQSLSTCMRERLCNEQVALSHFAPQAKELWDDFEPYFAMRRQNNPNYARDLEAVASRAAADS